MCIVIVSTIHPDYPLILLNNRDEFLSRPTAPANWWDAPDAHVLGGRDLQRPERGTWLGVTKQGRLACLTNFREEGEAVIAGRRSRGAIVTSFLKTSPSVADTQSTADAAKQLIAEGVSGVGGFSLLFGNLKDLKKSSAKRFDRGLDHGLAIVSNRSTDLNSVKWLFSGEDVNSRNATHALSNSHYGDRTWPKIVSAEGLVEAAIQESAQASITLGTPETAQELIERLLKVLSIDTLPRERNGQSWEVYTRQLRNSIFIPDIGDQPLEQKMRGDDISAATEGIGPNAVKSQGLGVYGTQKQTVILVDKDGKVTFLERTLFGDEGRRIRKGEGDRKYDFQIDEW